MAWFRRNRGEKSREQYETFSSGNKESAQELTGLSISVETSHLSQQVQEKQRERQDMQTTVDNLLERYESLRRGIHSRDGNKDTVKQLRDSLDANIKDLKAIRRDLKKQPDYPSFNEFKERLGQLTYYLENYAEVRQYIILGGKTSNIPRIIDSKKDAKRARKYEKRDAKYQQEMNEILHDVALTSMWTNDMESYEEYLKLVVNGDLEPSQHPFYARHIASFQLIKCINPSLYEALVPSGKKKKQSTRAAAGGVSAPRTTVSSLPNNPRCPTPEDSRPFYSRLGGKFTELLSNIFPSVETDPRKKRAWTQIGAVATLAGTVFLGYEAIKNAFSGKDTNPNKWTKTLGYAGTLLAVMNGDKILDSGINLFQDAFGYHPSEKIQITNDLFSTYGFSDTTALQTAEAHIGAPVATISALHFIPIYDLTGKDIVKYINDKFIFDYENYKSYINQYKRTDEQKKIVLAAGQKLKDDDSINDGLAAFNINDKSDLENIAGTDKEKTLADSSEVQRGRKECCDNVSSDINAKLNKEGLRPKNREAANAIVKEYNEKNGKDMDESELNKLMIKWMKDDKYLEIDGYKNTYKLEDIIDDENIDLETKTMHLFQDSDGSYIKFESYRELFNVAHLTNWIKDEFKGRKDAKSDTPFHIAIETGGDIEFDNTRIYELWKNETDVVDNGTMENMSPTLWNHRRAYVDYLNQRWQREGEESEKILSADVMRELYKEGLIAKDVESKKKIVKEYNEKKGSRANMDKSELNKLMIKWMRDDGYLEVNGYKNRYKLEDVINEERLDLNNKTILWFIDDNGRPIKFNSFVELFNVIYLTNWIKKKFRGRTDAVSDEPFHVAPEKLGGIEFDNTKFYELLKNEIDILKSSTIGEISPTLQSNKKSYVKYLNRRWNREGRVGREEDEEREEDEGREEIVRIDLTNYPELKTMNEQTGIYFTDAAEAQRTEGLLKALKQLNNARQLLSDKNNPFDIGYTIKKPFQENTLTFEKSDGRDLIINVGDLSQYPTILSEKEKFLAFINNPANGYYYGL